MTDINLDTAGMAPWLVKHHGGANQHRFDQLGLCPNLLDGCSLMCE